MAPPSSLAIDFGPPSNKVFVSERLDLWPLAECLDPVVVCGRLLHTCLAQPIYSHQHQLTDYTMFRVPRSDCVEDEG